MTDASLQERARAQGHQELLIAELNHRVRNILNLIKGLINQSSEGATDVASFTETIGGRVHALARAHDQITKENWSAASLHELVQTELQAYQEDKFNRVKMTGPDVLLEPTAFTTISLVVHELITNSAKYGALTDKRGMVEIEVKEEPDKAMVLYWREIGGPPVQAPTRRGFGTTIIERSIPFELQGAAQVQFDVTGLSATFMVPSIHIEKFRAYEPVVVQPIAEVTNETLSLGNVLVVEDNIIIAMDAEMFMQDLGATSVYVCSTVSAALDRVQSQDLSFALLDINLGAETSERIAVALHEQGVPFAFATGYGELNALNERFPKAKVIQKPYDQSAIAEVLPGLS